MPYDAFISYSHRADLAFAPRLQSALQRLAKPWWRARALAVFRDESDLGAASDLTQRIAAALLQSRCFVLLASPGAAGSKWVRREIEHWFARPKGADFDPALGFLVALTEGEIAWDEAAKDFDWQHTTALPDTLKGRFADEPLWIDLRGFKAESQLTLRHPDFARGVARLAAPIRGTTPAALIDDDLRRNRQARRTAYAAMAAILLAAVGAGAGWWSAFEQAERARTEARRAEAEADRARRAAAEEARQKAEAERQKQAAERSLAEAMNAAEALVIDIAEGLRDFAGVPVERLRAVLETAEKIYERLDRPDAPDDVRFGRASMFGVFSEAYRTLGETEAALDRAKRMREIMEGLGKAKPDDAAYQVQFARSQDKVGDVLVDRGELPGALAAYRLGLAIRERLVARSPDRAEWQSDLALSHMGIGRIYFLQGEQPLARGAYRKALAIWQRRTEADPRDADIRRNLASTHERIGDVMGVQRDLTGALASYRASLAIREQLAKEDPRNGALQNGLVLSHIRVGEILLRQVDGDGALAEFRTAKTLAERVVAEDPRNTDRQQALASAHERVGHVLNLTRDFDGALRAYEAEFAIWQRLSNLDPLNATWRHSLANAHSHVTWVQMRAGRLEEARHSLRQAIDIMEDLVAKHGDSVIFAKGLEMFREGLRTLDKKIAKGSDWGEDTEERPSAPR